MNEIHFEYEGKSARLSLQMLKRERAKPAVRRRTSTGEVSSVRVLNGQTQTLDKSKLTADDLINGDPELDLERGAFARARAFHAGLPSPRGKTGKSLTSSKRLRSCIHLLGKRRAPPSGLAPRPT